jgi:hypothetical protein
MSDILVLEHDYTVNLFGFQTIQALFFAEVVEFYEKKRGMINRMSSNTARLSKKAGVGYAEIPASFSVPGKGPGDQGKIVIPQRRRTVNVSDKTILAAANHGPADGVVNNALSVYQVETSLSFTPR